MVSISGSIPRATAPALHKLESRLQAPHGATDARRFGVTAVTIGNWQHRLDEKGSAALVQTRTPVNRFPDFVAALVQQLKRTVPAMGKRRIAQTLARAGLVLAKTSVERLAGRKLPVRPTPPASPKEKTPKALAASESGLIVTARAPNYVWHLDITTMPTLGGFWTPWWPFTVPSGWPFCWHVLVVVDHLSRAPVARAVFKQVPAAEDVCAVLEAGVAFAGRAPRHLVSDQGVQFTSDAYAAWCSRRGVKPRFGALGKHGSIAVIERFFRTLKQEGLRRIAVPLGLAAMTAELDRYLHWYSVDRPHTFLGGATPKEILASKAPASRRVGMEVRAKYPLRARRPGGVPRRRVRKRLELQVDFVGGLRHLPVVELRLAA